LTRRKLCERLATGAPHEGNDCPRCAKSGPDDATAGAGCRTLGLRGDDAVVGADAEGVEERDAEEAALLELEDGGEAGAARAVGLDGERGAAGEGRAVEVDVARFEGRDDVDLGRLDGDAAKRGLEALAGEKGAAGAAGEATDGQARELGAGLDESVGERAREAVGGRV